MKKQDTGNPQGGKAIPDKQEKFNFEKSVKVSSSRRGKVVPDK